MKRTTFQLMNHVDDLVDAAIASHSTSTVDRPWDKGPNLRRCPNQAAALKKLHAWVDGDGDSDSKSSYKFPHHEVNEDGTVGAANLGGCRNGLSRLSSADIPAGDIDAVRRHLQKHLDDGESTSNAGYARIVNVDTSRAEVHLYGMIGQWDITAADFAKQLKDIGRKDIDLHINSPGGSVFEATAIYEALKNHRGSIRSWIDGYAVSAASYVAMAGDEVIISPTGEMMVHDAMAIPDGPINPESCRNMLDILERTSDKIAGIYAEKTEQDPKVWRRAMRRESWYNAEDAVKSGLADRIGRSNDEPVSNHKWNFAIYNYAGRQQAPEPITTKLVVPDVGALLREAMNDAVREVFG